MKAYVDFDEYEALKERIEWLDDKIRSVTKSRDKWEQTALDFEKAYNVSYEFGYDAGMKAAVRILQDAIADGL